MEINWKGWFKNVKRVSEGGGGGAGRGTTGTRESGKRGRITWPWPLPFHISLTTPPVTAPSPPSPSPFLSTFLFPIITFSYFIINFSCVLLFLLITVSTKFSGHVKTLSQRKSKREIRCSSCSPPNVTVGMMRTRPFHSLVKRDRSNAVSSRRTFFTLIYASILTIFLCPFSYISYFFQVKL